MNVGQGHVSKPNQNFSIKKGIPSVTLCGFSNYGAFYRLEGGKVDIDEGGIENLSSEGF